MKQSGFKARSFLFICFIHEKVLCSAYKGVPFLHISLSLLLSDLVIVCSALEGNYRTIWHRPRNDRKHEDKPGPENPLAHSNSTSLLILHSLFSANSSAATDQAFFAGGCSYSSARVVRTRKTSQIKHSNICCINIYIYTPEKGGDESQPLRQGGCPQG